MTPHTLSLTPAQDKALNQALQAHQQAHTSGQAWAVAESSLRLARWYREVGALDMALPLLSQGLVSAPGVDQRVEMLCEAVNVLVQQSRQQETQMSGSGRTARDQVRDHVFEISRLTPQLADAAWEAKVLLHLSDVLERFGDRGDAAKLQHRAMSLMGSAGQPAQPAFNPNLMPGLGRLADI